jgi:cobalamin synthase
MKCFNHTSTDAIGVCKHCNKGLCRECAVEAAGSLSCRGACEEQVALVNRLARQAGASYGKTSRAYLRSTVVYFVLGVVFAVFAFRTEISLLRTMLIIMALVLFIGGVFYLWSSREFGRD